MSRGEIMKRNKLKKFNNMRTWNNSLIFRLLARQIIMLIKLINRIILPNRKLKLFLKFNWASKTFHPRASHQNMILLLLTVTSR